MNDFFTMGSDPIVFQDDDADILVMIACARGCAVRQGNRQKRGMSAC